MAKESSQPSIYRIEACTFELIRAERNGGFSPVILIGVTEANFIFLKTTGHMSKSKCKDARMEPTPI